MKEKQEKKRKISTALWYAAGILFWILVWLIASLAVGKEIVLPSPGTVAKEFVRLLGTGGFYLSLLRSFASIILISFAQATLTPTLTSPQSLRKATDSFRIDRYTELLISAAMTEAHTRSEDLRML
jgi:hypothetical protein